MKFAVPTWICGGTGQDELNGVGYIHDATQPDDGNGNCLMNLPDHTQSNLV